MDLRKLKTLLDLVSESNIAELEVTEGESTVRIVKSVPPVYLPAAPAESQLTTFTQAAPAPIVSMEGAASAAPGPQAHLLTSPMVGTFYRASSPGSEPFVQIGDTVREGQTLCIIEAMKLLNEIEADKAGVVKEICVENGQAVEFGQTLFVIG